MARAKETIVTLILLCLIVLGMMYVIAALVDRDEDSINKLLSKFGYQYNLRMKKKMIFSHFFFYRCFCVPSVPVFLCLVPGRAHAADLHASRLRTPLHHRRGSRHQADFYEELGR